MMVTTFVAGISHLGIEFRVRRLLLCLWSFPSLYVVELNPLLDVLDSATLLFFLHLAAHDYRR
jgi:hypothetical protein